MDPASPRSGHAALLVGLGWVLKGDRAQADAWRERAVQALAAGSREERAVAELLCPDAPISLEMVDEVSDAPIAWAAVLVTLADMHPDLREALFAEVRRLCPAPGFARRFLTRVMAAIEAQAPAAAPRLPPGARRSDTGLAR